MTNYFFMIIYLGPASFRNGSLFNQLRENAPLITCFGQMYIYFYEYPTFSGRISETFEKNVNENIQCDHDHAYSSSKQKMCTWVSVESWGMLKISFPNTTQINK